MNRWKSTSDLSSSSSNHLQFISMNIKSSKWDRIKETVGKTDIKDLLCAKFESEIGGSDRDIARTESQKQLAEQIPHLVDAIGEGLSPLVYIQSLALGVSIKSKVFQCDFMPPNFRELYEEKQLLFLYVPLIMKLIEAKDQIIKFMPALMHKMFDMCACLEYLRKHDDTWDFPEEISEFLIEIRKVQKPRYVWEVSLVVVGQDTRFDYSGKDWVDQIELVGLQQALRSIITKCDKGKNFNLPNLGPLREHRDQIKDYDLVVLLVESLPYIANSMVDIRPAEYLYPTVYAAFNNLEFEQKLKIIELVRKMDEKRELPTKMKKIDTDMNNKSDFAVNKVCNDRAMAPRDAADVLALHVCFNLRYTFKTLLKVAAENNDCKRVLQVWGEFTGVLDIPCHDASIRRSTPMMTAACNQLCKDTVKMWKCEANKKHQPQGRQQWSGGGNRQQWRQPLQNHADSTAPFVLHKSLHNYAQGIGEACSMGLAEETGVLLKYYAVPKMGSSDKEEVVLWLYIIKELFANGIQLPLDFIEPEEPEESDDFWDAVSEPAGKKPEPAKPEPMFIPVQDISEPAAKTEQKDMKEEESKAEEGESAATTEASGEAEKAESIDEKGDRSTNHNTTTDTDSIEVAVEAVEVMQADISHEEKEERAVAETASDTETASTPPHVDTPQVTPEPTDTETTPEVTDTEPTDTEPTDTEPTPDVTDTEPTDLDVTAEGTDSQLSTDTDLAAARVESDITTTDYDTASQKETDGATTDEDMVVDHMHLARPQVNGIMENEDSGLVPLVEETAPKQTEPKRIVDPSLVNVAELVVALVNVVHNDNSQSDVYRKAVFTGVVETFESISEYMKSRELKFCPDVAPWITEKLKDVHWLQKVLLLPHLAADVFEENGVKIGVPRAVPAMLKENVACDGTLVHDEKMKDMTGFKILMEMKKKAWLNDLLPLLKEDALSEAALAKLLADELSELCEQEMTDVFQIVKLVVDKTIVTIDHFAPVDIISRSVKVAITDAVDAAKSIVAAGGLHKFQAVIRHFVKISGVPKVGVKQKVKVVTEKLAEERLASAQFYCHLTKYFMELVAVVQANGLDINQSELSHELNSLWECTHKPLKECVAKCPVDIKESKPPASDDRIGTEPYGAALTNGETHNTRDDPLEKFKRTHRDGASADIGSTLGISAKCAKCRKTGHDIDFCPTWKDCKLCGADGHSTSACHLCRRCLLTKHDGNLCDQEAYIRNSLCSHCNIRGHLSRACPEPSAKCNYCKQTGHPISLCPTKDKREMLTCRRCSKPGHMERDCTEGYVVRRGITCYNCNMDGHMSRECPNKGQPAPTVNRLPTVNLAAKADDTGSSQDATEEESLDDGRPDLNDPADFPLLCKPRDAGTPDDTFDGTVVDGAATGQGYPAIMSVKQLQNLGSQTAPVPITVAAGVPTSRHMPYPLFPASSAVGAGAGTVLGGVFNPLIPFACSTVANLMDASYADPQSYNLHYSSSMPAPTQSHMSGYPAGFPLDHPLNAAAYASSPTGTYPSEYKPFKTPVSLWTSAHEQQSAAAVRPCVDPGLGFSEPPAPPALPAPIGQKHRSSSSEDPESPILPKKNCHECGKTGHLSQDCDQLVSNRKEKPADLLAEGLEVLQALPLPAEEEEFDIEELDDQQNLLNLKNEVQNLEQTHQMPHEQEHLDWPEEPGLAQGGRDDSEGQMPRGGFHGSQRGRGGRGGGRGSWDRGGGGRGSWDERGTRGHARYSEQRRHQDDRPMYPYDGPRRGNFNAVFPGYHNDRRGRGNNQEYRTNDGTFRGQERGGRGGRNMNRGNEGYGRPRNEDGRGRAGGRGGQGHSENDGNWRRAASNDGATNEFRRHPPTAHGENENRNGPASSSSREDQQGKRDGGSSSSKSSHGGKARRSKPRNTRGLNKE